MRILKGLKGHPLPCGCLAGVYETYDGQIVAILDARSPACSNPLHEPGRTIQMEESRNGEIGQ